MFVATLTFIVSCHADRPSIVGGADNSLDSRWSRESTFSFSKGGGPRRSACMGAHDRYRLHGTFSCVKWGPPLVHTSLHSVTLQNIGEARIFFFIKRSRSRSDRSGLSDSQGSLADLME